MPIPAGWRYLTDEEAQIESAAGNSDIHNTLIRDSDKAVSSIQELGVQLDEEGSAVGRGARFAGRQIAKGLIPAVAGRGIGALGGLATSAIAGAPVAQGGGVIPLLGTLAGAVAGGAGTSYGQEKLLRSLASKSPTGRVAEFQRRSEQDVRQHPYLAQLASLATAIPAGGGAVSKLATREGAKRAAIQGGLQGAIDVPSQIISKGEVDPVELGIAVLGGAATGEPIRGVRNLERRALSKLPTSARPFVESFAPAMAPDVRPSALDVARIERGAGTDIVSGVNKSRMPLHMQEGWNPDYYVGAPLEELKQLKTPFAEQVIRLRKAKVPLDANDINRLARGSRDFNATASDIMLDKFKQLRGEAPVEEGSAVALAKPLEVPSGKLASQSAVDITQAHKDARVKQLVEMTPEELVADAGSDALAIAEMRKAGFVVDEANVKALMTGAKTAPIPADVKKVVVPGAKAVDQPAENAGVVNTIEDLIAQRKTELEKTMKGIVKTQAAPEVQEVLGEQAIKKKEVSGEERHAGVAPGLFKPIKDVVSQAVRPGLSRVESKFGEVGKKFKKRYEEMRVTAKQLINPYHDEINRITGNLSRESLERTSQFIDERKYTGTSKLVLSPEEQAAVTAFDEVQRLTAIERSKPNSPLVNEIVDGVVTPRAFRPKPNYYSEQPNQKFWDAAQNKLGAAERDRIMNLFISHQMKFGGATRDQALKVWNDVTTIASGNAAPYVEYAQLRLPEGIGLPDELKLNAWDSLRKQVTKQGMDLAWHRTIESDPDLGPAMNYRDDGRGNKWGVVESNALGADPDVRAAMKDYVGALDPAAQRFEAWDRFIKGGIVQTPTQVWNYAQSFTVLGEILKPRDLAAIQKGIVGMFSRKGQQTAIQSGSIRPGRNLNPATSEDAGGLLNMISDLQQHLTLNEPLEKGHRTFFDIVGREISRNRLRDGDVDFFDKWGPENWQSLPPDALTNYTASRITEAMAGGYSAEELPNWLLRGSGSYVKPFFSLARWAVGRTNHWIENVYKPASKGNIGPLIGSVLGGTLSAGAVNYLKEELTNRKPRELTWDEYLKLGGEDTAYTLLSKANTAGYAGILGSSLFQLFAASKGEAPYGFSNPLIGAVSETAERSMQYLNAVSNGDVEPLDGLVTLGAQLIQDRIQLARTLLETRPDEGKREEKIARRTGYLPPQPLSAGSHLSNPFGATAAYRKGDAKGLAKLVGNRIAQRREVPMPTSAVKQPGVYDFIANTQGEIAREAALQRDIEKSRRDAALLGEAVSRR